MYRVYVQLWNGPLVYYYFGVKDRLEVNFSLSQLFESVIFPNPVVRSNYSIHMRAEVDMKVTYEVINANLEVLYRTKYILGAGHNQPHLIADANALPEGTLFHRFTFEDGSQQTHQAIHLD